MKTSINRKKINKMEKIAIVFWSAIYVAMSVIMREVVYKTNPAENWLGTVNGVILLAFGLGLITFVILYLIFDEPGSGWDGYGRGLLIFFGAFLGAVVGIVLAFLPPFKQAFRVNVFLYYALPALITAIFIAALIAGLIDKFLLKK